MEFDLAVYYCEEGLNRSNAMKRSYYKCIEKHVAIMKNIIEEADKEEKEIEQANKILFQKEKERMIKEALDNEFLSAEAKEALCKAINDYKF